MTYTPIYSLRLYSNKIVKIQEKEFKKKNEKQIEAAKENFNKKKFSGTISIETNRVIKNKLDLWLNSLISAYYKNIRDRNNKKRLPIFITLTLSSAQRHNDKDIKRNMLDRFITKIKNNTDCLNVFWRAEVQKNNNIHFHLITDTFIEFDKIRKYWNDIQEEHGYIEPFFNKFQHRNPPSIHVKSISDVSNFVAYCIKYATKEAEGRKIEGKLWGMSDNIRNLKAKPIDLEEKIWAEVSQAIDNKDVHIFKKDFIEVYFFKKSIKDNPLMNYTKSILLKNEIDLFNQCYVNQNNSRSTLQNNDDLELFVESDTNISINNDKFFGFEETKNNDLFASFTNLYFNNH
jgi:hypothetical protein